MAARKPSKKVTVAMIAAVIKIVKIGFTPNKPGIWKVIAENGTPEYYEQQALMEIKKIGVGETPPIFRLCSAIRYLILAWIGREQEVQ